MPINDARVSVRKLKFAWPELKSRRQFPRAEKRFYFGAGIFNGRIVRFHHNLSATTFDSHPKIGHIEFNWRGPVVIDTFRVSHGVIERIDVGIIHCNIQ
jgi:hypothetical protein